MTLRKDLRKGDSKTVSSRAKMSNSPHTTKASDCAHARKHRSLETYLTGVEL